MYLLPLLKILDSDFEGWDGGNGYKITRKQPTMEDVIVQVGAKPGR